ncbi:hypothetical protein BDB01DRAFT_806678 [Pilobolus umbonatus]|nr:hypothetical protein BDB01DRAFT_806678 [Pilobolus umbonatus]
MKSETTKSVQKKKKAARACVHCQKAHLTCDDSRPCQRCIKRNLATTCTDGARKKAKYLQEIEDTKSISSSNYSTHSNTPVQPYIADTTNNFQPQVYMDTDTNSASNLNPNNTMLSMDNYGFGSNAANLEYSILSNMLGSSLNNRTTPRTDMNTIWSGDSTSPLSLDTSFLPTSNIVHSNPFQNKHIPSISSSAVGTSEVSASGISSISAYGDGAVVAKVASPVTPNTGPSIKRRNQIITPEKAYASATKPFSYADGYHYLINYVKTRMSKEDLMRISRALALFRPSVLASMMNLTESDLIFTEKCLQRTLLEYEKLISYSGTPTVVWRRTGEIALVGKEFSLLTQWSRDTLLSKKTYIYELMSNPSAVEYWEKYALHAFDNTDSAVFSTCILLSPTKRVVPCTFCFTIKRDIFDLPSVIIGNFLPILS